MMKDRSHNLLSKVEAMVPHDEFVSPLEREKNRTLKLLRMQIADKYQEERGEK